MELNAIDRIETVLEIEIQANSKVKILVVRKNVTYRFKI